MSEIDGVRYLHLGTPWVQGAMRVAKPKVVELVYVQRMLAGLLWRPTDELAEGHAVQLGLGAASLTRFTLQTLRLPTTVVEINPHVVFACHAWFKLPRNGPLLDVQVADAGAWLASQAASRLAGQTALLHVDLYDHEAAAPVLDDVDFYAGCRALLMPGGVMTVNLFGRQASFARSMGYLAQVFGAQFLWSLRPTREGNTIAVATRDAPLPDPETLKSRALALERQFIALGLRATQWPRMVRPYQAP
jgi:spermidine synthase